MDLRKIFTSRLLLRMPVENDLNQAFEIHGDPATNIFNPSGPDPLKDITLERLKKWINHWQKYGFGYWAASIKENPERIIGFGGIMFKEIANENFLNLYFRFRPEAWGRGYANETAQKAIETAFNFLDYEQISATVRPDNSNSIKALERLGMKFQHKINDGWGESLLYIMKKEDFKKRGTAV